MPLTFLIGDWEQLLTAPSYIGLFERGLHSNLEIHQMQRDTKRDEVHGSVRYGTLDSPQGQIQGLPQARRKAAARPRPLQVFASNKTGSARCNGLNA